MMIRYLAIVAFNLLSYVVGLVAQLGEHCNFFRLRWERLGGVQFPIGSANFVFLLAIHSQLGELRGYARRPFAYHHLLFYKRHQLTILVD